MTNTKEYLKQNKQWIAEHVFTGASLMPNTEYFELIETSKNFRCTMNAWVNNIYNIYLKIQMFARYCLCLLLINVLLIYQAIFKGIF